MNTRFPKKSLEKKIGPVRVISSTRELRNTFRYWAGRIYDMLGVKGQERESSLNRIDTWFPINGMLSKSIQKFSSKHTYLPTGAMPLTTPMFTMPGRDAVSGCRTIVRCCITAM